MICARCEEPVLPGEVTEELVREAMSSALPPLTVHSECPRDRRRGARRGRVPPRVPPTR